MITNKTENLEHIEEALRTQSKHPLGTPFKIAACTDGPLPGLPEFHRITVWSDTWEKKLNKYIYEQVIGMSAVPYLLCVIPKIWVVCRKHLKAHEKRRAVDIPLKKAHGSL